MAMAGPAGKEAPLHCIPAVITEISWPEMLPPDAMPADNGYTVALAGDIMMGTTFPEERLPASDGNELFRGLSGCALIGGHRCGEPRRGAFR